MLLQWGEDIVGSISWRKPKEAEGSGDVEGTDVIKSVNVSSQFGSLSYSVESTAGQTIWDFLTFLTIFIHFPSNEKLI